MPVKFLVRGNCPAIVTPFTASGEIMMDVRIPTKAATDTDNELPLFGVSKARLPMALEPAKSGSCRPCLQ
jgi:hypothetical protein